MANLVYYSDERKEFKEAFEKKLTYQEAEIIYSKLCHHFKLREVRIEWTSGRNHPKCASYRIILNYDYNSIGVLCHEVAHLYQLQKPRKFTNWHNKEHKKIMKRMVNYCNKKNWFEQELQRRLKPKVKTEPTQQENKAKELIKLQEKIVKCEKKILFYQRKLSKIKKSYNLKMAWQERKNNLQLIIGELEKYGK
jgi:hypothetical protein